MRQQKWKGSLEDHLTCKVDVAGALEWPRLRPQLQQDHLGTVYSSSSSSSCSISLSPHQLVKPSNDWPSNSELVLSVREYKCTSKKQHYFLMAVGK